MLLVEGRDDLARVFASDPRGHAEHHLLHSTQWLQAIQQAGRVAANKAGHRTFITIVINRAPCHAKWLPGDGFDEDRTGLQGNPSGELRRGCTGKLVEALAGVRSALNSPNEGAGLRFLLAMLGTYESIAAAGMSNREHQGPTTNRDLRALIRGGWTLRALETSDGSLSNYGRILADGIRHAEAWCGVAT